MPEQTSQHIVIVGGGIAGMAVAYKIQEEARRTGNPISFTLVEAGDHLGGKIVTEQVDGFTIEGGPDSVLRQKPWASDLAIELGLGDDLIGTNDKERQVFVLNKGKLVPLPDGVWSIVPTKFMPFITTRLISWPGKIRMGLDLFIPRFKGDEDETMAHFVRRRLGDEALYKIAAPLLSGIHVSDPEKQSLLATFPRFRNTEKKYGSLTRGMIAEGRRMAAMKKANAGKPPSKVPQSAFITLKDGLGELVKKLESRLTGGRIVCGVQAMALSRQADGSYHIQLDNGEVLQADAVVLAIPSFAAAGLLQPFAPGVAEVLNSIPYVSTATVSLGYRKGDIRKPFTGHGVLVPITENRKISALTYTSFKFTHRAPQDHLLLRCFLGGPGHEEEVELGDADMLALVRQELKSLLSIDAEPVVTRIFRWSKANPQYNLGHLNKVKAIRAGLQAFPGLYVTGCAYDGVGVPDCVKQGQETAALALDHLTRVTTTASV